MAYFVGPGSFRTSYRSGDRSNNAFEIVTPMSLEDTLSSKSVHHIGVAEVNETGYVLYRPFGNGVKNENGGAMLMDANPNAFRNWVASFPEERVLRYAFFDDEIGPESDMGLILTFQYRRFTRTAHIPSTFAVENWNNVRPADITRLSFVFSALSHELTVQETPVSGSAISPRETRYIQNRPSVRISPTG